MTLYKKITLYTIMLLISINVSKAQTIDDNKVDINNKIIFANNLIAHINYNLYELDIYQDRLIIWFENPNKKMETIPKFNFNPFTNKKIAITEKVENSVFDFNYHLKKIDLQTHDFDLQCKKLLNLRSPNSEVFRKDVFSIIKNIKTQAKEISETSYDYSRASSISFKNNKYPERLGNVKNMVSQCKNLILAIRNNNKSQARDYLNLLDKSLLDSKNNLIFSESSVLKNPFDEDFKKLSQSISEKSFKIAAWAEQFLQSSFSEKGHNNLLRNCIYEFNETNNNSGCATIFNNYLQKIDESYMYFVEEPNTLIAEEIEDYSITEKDYVVIDLKKPKKNIEPAIEIETTIIPEIVKEVTQKEHQEYDSKNNNSLSGSLPNNIIMLLDVSVSMKTSEKLPILKRSIKHFLNIMRDEDKISLITYSGETKILVSGGSKFNKASIIDTLSTVKSSGGSDIYNALKEAYRIGQQNFIPNGNNKIIIASDGIFGITYKTLDYVSEITKEDFSLSIFQYSKPNEDINIKSLKNLATTGKGSYRIIYNTTEAISEMMKEIKKQDNTH